MGDIRTITVNNEQYDIISKDDHTHANKAILDKIINKNDNLIYGIKNGDLAQIEQSGSSVTVDDALNSTSENPVQNKVINTALINKVDKDGNKVLSDNNFTKLDKTAIEKNTTNIGDMSIAKAICPEDKTYYKYDGQATCSASGTTTSMGYAKFYDLTPMKNADGFVLLIK